MRTDRELLQLALDKFPCASDFIQVEDKLIEEIRARLAEPEEEPVAWAAKQGMVSKFKQWEDADPLYRHPARPPVLLSDDDIREIMLTNGFTIKDGYSDLKPYVFHAVRAIEQAVLEKNR